MASFENGKNYHGFTLVQSENIEEIRNKGFLFRHEKSGAELLVLENDDENKAFGICFRTPPNDNTGLPHILEHSVLNGSRKFKAKDPFAEMLKTGLASFINAFTFPDKTMYPVASKNEKDFMNLMDLYMDSVFFPLLTKETFLQEGWHYDIKEKNEELKYKGVVYNEMKGVFSAAESVIEKAKNELLFPDAVYKYVYGGDPESIVDLQYKDFIDFHKNYYHPSNSKFIIYGNGNTEKYMEFINKEYLSLFDKIEVNSQISIQKSLKAKQKISGIYPISESENFEKKTYILKSYVLDEVKNREFDLSFSILSEILSGMDSSPLRRALIESGYGEDLLGGEFNNYMIQGLYEIGLSGTDEIIDGKNIPDEVEKIIEKTLKTLVEKGIDTKLIEAATNKLEFALREANFGDFPKGIVYFIEAMRAWLYDGNPFDTIKFEKELKKIKSEYKNGYFEKMIEKFLLKNNHTSLVIMKPDKEVEGIQEKKVQEKLSKIKTSFSVEKLEELVNETVKLETLQMTPNSREILDTLPKLSLADIGKDPQKYPTEIRKILDRTVLCHDLFTNGITYFTIGFDFGKLPDNAIPYISILASAIKYLGTKNRTPEEIEQDLMINTGGIDISKYITAHSKTNARVNYLLFSGKATVDKFEKLTEILSDILNNADLKNKSKFKEIILRKKNEMKNYISSSGHSAAKTRIKAMLSKEGIRSELSSGILYYEFLENIAKEIENDADLFLKKITAVKNMLIKKENIIINITNDIKEIEKTTPVLEKLIKSIEEKEVENVELNTIGKLSENEGLILSSQVQYVGLGTNLYSDKFKRSGKINVLKKVIDIDYLWQNVRLKGGAYGGFSVFDAITGEWYFLSYRDPNLSETVNVYKQTPEFIKNITFNEKETEEVIIGALQPMEKPLTPSLKGMKEFENYLTGYYYEDLKKEREEILSVKPNDFNKFADIFNCALEKSKICVIGSKSKIESNKNIFSEIKNIFEN